MQFKVKGIISYPHLYQARAVEAAQDPKYSVSVLIKKTDTQVAAVQSVIDQEKLAGWPSGFPVAGKVFMKDCAVAFPEDPRLHGYMVISGNSQLKDKPVVVDMSMTPVIDPSQIYAGAVCWVAFNSFCYKKAVNKGVAAGLNAVMVTDEVGELGRLDGRPSVESMFSDVVGGSAAAVAPSPAAPPVAPSTPPDYVMTPAAGALVRDDYIKAGWTDQQLISQGYMTLPGGVKPSFAG